MNKQLNEKLLRIKQYFSQKPENILIGWIKEGNPKPNIVWDKNRLNQYIDFLKVCDGASLGEVVIFPSKDVVKNQFYTEIMPGGQNEWFVIGHILYEPIVLKKSDSKIYRFYRDDHFKFPKDCFGKFDDFLLTYVLGKKYSEIIPVDKNDDWLMLLLELQIIK